LMSTSDMLSEHAARLRSIAAQLVVEVDAFKKRIGSGQHVAAVTSDDLEDYPNDGPKTDPAITLAKLPPVRPGMTEQDVSAAFTLLAAALANAEAVALAAGRFVDVHSRGGRT
jgi:hypothetical protein